MKLMEEDKSLRSSSEEKGRGLRRWRDLHFWGRVWRVLWVAVLAVVLFTWLQVLLGSFINPPL